MSRILAAALLLAALPALLAREAPIPQEPVPESAASISQNDIETAFVPMINTTSANITCNDACASKGMGWVALNAGSGVTLNRTMCTAVVNKVTFIGTAFRASSRSYVCQFRTAASAAVQSRTGRQGFTCGCAYACAAADYEYDWNYDNNNTPGGKPKPGTTVDYEVSKCRKTFWNQSPAPQATVGPKCTCANGCICRVAVNTATKNYITGWMAKDSTSCITQLGARPRADLFYQCKP